MNILVPKSFFEIYSLMSARHISCLLEFDKLKDCQRLSFKEGYFNMSDLSASPINASKAEAERHRYPRMSLSSLRRG